MSRLSLFLMKENEKSFFLKKCLLNKVTIIQFWQKNGPFTFAESLFKFKSRWRKREKEKSSSGLLFFICDKTAETTSQVLQCSRAGLSFVTRFWGMLQSFWIYGCSKVLTLTIWAEENVTWLHTDMLSKQALKRLGLWHFQGKNCS